jgi:hypothetical protein
MSVRSAIQAPELKDEAFARDRFSMCGLVTARAYKLSRLEAREGIPRLFRDRRRTPAGPLPPQRMHQYHLTVPCPRVALTQGGSS